jgi:hypothetical protein
MNKNLKAIWSIGVAYRQIREDRSRFIPAAHHHHAHFFLLIPIAIVSHKPSVRSSAPPALYPNFTPNPGFHECVNSWFFPSNLRIAISVRPSHPLTSTQKVPHQPTFSEYKPLYGISPLFIIPNFNESFILELN